MSIVGICKYNTERCFDFDDKYVGLCFSKKDWIKRMNYLSEKTFEYIENSRYYVAK